MLSRGLRPVSTLAFARLIFANNKLFVSERFSLWGTQIVMELHTVDGPGWKFHPQGSNQLHQMPAFRKTA